jgi:hypothetical protein
MALRQRWDVTTCLPCRDRKLIRARKRPWTARFLTVSIPHAFFCFPCCCVQFPPASTPPLYWIPCNVDWLSYQSQQYPHRRPRGWRTRERPGPIMRRSLPQTLRLSQPTRRRLQPPDQHHCQFKAAMVQAAPTPLPSLRSPLIRSTCPRAALHLQLRSPYQPALSPHPRPRLHPCPRHLAPKPSWRCLTCTEGDSSVQCALWSRTPVPA